MQLIPSMDLLQGRVVRLRHGDPRQATFYDERPEAWIERLALAGARRIHLVDLDGAFGEPRQQLFRAFPVRWPSIRFQTGGGLRSREAVQAVLDVGFEAVVGTLAVENPQALAGLPPQGIITALDMKDGEVVTHGWRKHAEAGGASFRAELLALGFDRALVTDVNRDGTLQGPGWEAIAAVATQGFRVQASGGVRTLADVETAARTPGVIGVISGKALLDGILDLNDPAVRAAMTADEGGV